MAYESSTMPEPTALDFRACCIAVAGGELTAFGLVALGVLALHTYGVLVFLVTPLVAGAVTGYLLLKGTTATMGETFAVTGVMLGAVALGFFALAFEGAICLVMAAPVAVPMALVGAFVGRGLAGADDRPKRWFLSGLLIVPAGTFVDSTTLPDRDSHVVLSVVEI